MWDLSKNDGPTSNVLMHIIIYSTVYEKNRICIRIGSTELYIYFGIRAAIKLLGKKRVLHLTLMAVGAGGAPSVHKKLWRKWVGRVRHAIQNH